MIDKKSLAAQNAARSETTDESGLKPSESFRLVKKVLWIILFANVAVSILKIVVGTIINSSSMAADGFHSLADGSSNAVGLIGIRMAAKPSDKEHPYGHWKFETMAGMIIAGMLALIGIRVIMTAADRFIHPVAPDITVESLIALVLTLAINIVVSVLEYRRGKKLNSLILISDSMHTRSDIYVSISVLTALAGIKLGLPAWIDPVVSLVVAGFILHAAYEIFKMNSHVLLDSAVIDTDKVKSIVLSFPQVKDIHNIRSRGDENNLYIDMHIMMDSDMHIEESHELIHEIEDKIRIELNERAQVTAHVEPYENNSD